MDGILRRINVLLMDQDGGATTTGNVATNTAKGKVPVIGMRYRKRKRKNKLGTETTVHEKEGECPEGQKWWPIKKKCIPVGD